MEETQGPLAGRTALITGGARRIGAEIARDLHGAGMNIAIHYGRSADEARALQDALEARRGGSTVLVQGDVLDTAGLPALVTAATEPWGRLDVLINNASSFYPTPLGTATPEQWEDLMGTNLRAPFFLAQAARHRLEEARGCIVNLADIHADRPMPEHPIYCAAKAGLTMLTRALAMDLGPAVRVNAVAPGAILWPESGVDEAHRREILHRTPLERTGEPSDVARAVRFLLADAPFVTGHVLAVDGGQSLGW